MIWLWSEDMHVVRILSSDKFYHIKPQLNDYHFSSIFRLQCYQYLIIVYIYGVPLSANAPTVLYNSL